MSPARQQEAETSVAQVLRARLESKISHLQISFSISISFAGFSRAMNGNYDGSHNDETTAKINSSRRAEAASLSAFSAG